MANCLDESTKLGLITRGGVLKIKKSAGEIWNAVPG
jgi:hypothetical protein